MRRIENVTMDLMKPGQTPMDFLLEQLLDKGSKNQLNWVATDIPTEFVLGFKNYAISIRFDRKNTDNQALYIFSLFNAKGERMDSILAPQSHQRFVDLELLWKNAHGTTNEVHKAVMEISQEIHRLGPVGRTNPKSDNES